MSGSYIVVDTGPWIFGKKVLLPAGLIVRVDADDRRVHVNQTKDQIQNAPEFNEDTYRDDAYRSEVGAITVTPPLARKTPTAPASRPIPPIGRPALTMVATIGPIPPAESLLG